MVGDFLIEYIVSDSTCALDAAVRAVIETTLNSAILPRGRRELALPAEGASKIQRCGIFIKSTFALRLSISSIMSLGECSEIMTDTEVFSPFVTKRRQY